MSLERKSSTQVLLPTKLLSSDHITLVFMHEYLIVFGNKLTIGSVCFKSRHIMYRSADMPIFLGSAHKYTFEIEVSSY